MGSAYASYLLQRTQVGIALWEVVKHIWKAVDGGHDIPAVEPQTGYRPAGPFPPVSHPVWAGFSVAAVSGFASHLRHGIQGK